MHGFEFYQRVLSPFYFANMSLIPLYIFIILFYLQLILFFLFLIILFLNKKQIFIIQSILVYLILNYNSNILRLNVANNDAFGII